MKNTDKPLVLSGDGQYDSPGHCAKYCAYTVVENSTGSALDFQIAQKVQYKGDLEKAACQEVLPKVTGEHKLLVSKLVTDQHLGIGKMMREEFQSIEHDSDVWHVF